MKRSKLAEMKHYVCQRRRRCQSWRSLKERTATVASRTLVCPGDAELDLLRAASLN